MLPSLLNNALFGLIRDAKAQMEESCTSTLRNSDPYANPSAIARAQGQLEALAILDDTALKRYEKQINDRIKAKTNPEEEEI